jgi:hypothetical protein
MTHKKTTITLHVKHDIRFTAYEIASLAFDFLGGRFDRKAVELDVDNNIITFNLDFSESFKVITQFESVTEIFKTLKYYAEEEAKDKEALEVA